MNDIIQQFLGREAGPLVQFIKYAFTGVIATSVDVLVFYALSWKLLPAMKENDPLAKLFKLSITHVEEDVRSRRFIINTIIAFFFSNTTCYIINVLWVFESGRYAWYIEMALFYGASGISIALGTAVGWAMIKWFHLSTTSSYIAKGVAALLINFAARKFIIFKG
ncbi:MAG: GtrA family protein [Spartobacteria bacterium]|nr:GtrA family protein [Spartobacteria bacterium]